MTSKTLIENYVDALQAGDVPTVRSFFADDATWHLHGELPLSGTYRGRDTIIDGFLLKALDHYEPGSISIEVTNLVASDDQVALEWTSRARNREGEPYENQCIGVFAVRDGKIASVREYMDTEYARRVALR
jgi:ketosteroid isomerase-like protein